MAVHLIEPIFLAHVQHGGQEQSVIWVVPKGFHVSEVQVVQPLWWGVADRSSETVEFDLHLAGVVVCVTVNHRLDRDLEVRQKILLVTQEVVAGHLPEELKNLAD